MPSRLAWLALLGASMAALAQTAPPQKLNLVVLNQKTVICKLELDKPVPEWAAKGRFQSLIRTEDELTAIAADHAGIPGSATCDRGWRLIKLQGPIPFSSTGILSSVAAPLAAAKISIVAVPTYDTDYVMVKEEKLEAAVKALRAAGHSVKY